MASTPRIQFSLRTVFLATAGTCVVLALSHRPAVFGLALSSFLVSMAFFFESPRARNLIVYIGLGLVALLTTLLDSAFPIILSPHDALSAFAVGFSFAAPLMHGTQWRRGAIALAVCFAWLLLVGNTGWNPRKPFWRAYASIQQGMTQREVEQQFRREFAGEVPAHRYDANHWFFYLDPNDGRYNAEVISIDVKNGSVAMAAYLPD